MLTIHNLTHAYGSQVVLRNINLEVAQGEIVCILGPSGCGKTTLLRLIAGLEPVQIGDITLQGQSITNIPTHSRQFGLMFQEFALFPHMNVAENVRFGLQMRNTPKAVQDNRLEEVLTLVGLNGMETRKISELSGGERQRVALARSLAPEPKLLMLDEPLGSLDAALKGQLAIDLRQIIKHTHTTSLYVTHDQHEAFSIADRVVVMRQGTIEQIAEPETLYLRPETHFVANFLELENVLPVEQYDEKLIYTPLGAFPFSSLQAPPKYLLLHPDMLQITMEKPAYTSDTTQILPVTIEKVVYVGDTYRVWVSAQANHTARLLAKTPALGEKPVPGNTAWLSFEPELMIPLRE